MKQAYILAARRTAGCKANKGKFSGTRPDDLAAAAIKGAIESAGIDPAELEDVIMGCAFPEAEQGMNVARIAAMKAGVPYSVPGMTINRFCSSGLQSIAIAAERIMAGFADVVLAGGVESMSMTPMGGLKYSVNPSLMGANPESYSTMGITAELVAQKYGIGREAQDEFAYQSHMKAAKAIDDGKFADEIIPVEVDRASLQEKKMVTEKETVAIDDGVRRDTTIEGLARLKPAFKVDGSVTAGNASQMTDGAAAAIVVSEDYLKRSGRSPLARFIGYAVRGVAPEIMGIGPVEAVPAALSRAGMKIGDVGLIELNEAFAAQSLAVIGQLGLDRSILNVNGGAIALGHPLGCTGAKLLATLLSEMGRRKTKIGMVTMCVGGGMGAAGLFERL
ncbi:MAG: acetyl-CoA C-acyltransferase [Nitrospinota bacterium]|nr:acetyl-CoA C-acyltransferase [Nitrospinota bacterium]